MKSTVAMSLPGIVQEEAPSMLYVSRNGPFKHLRIVSSSTRREAATPALPYSFLYMPKAGAQMARKGAFLSDPPQQN